MILHFRTKDISNSKHCSISSNLVLSEQHLLNFPFLRKKTRYHRAKEKLTQDATPKYPSLPLSQSRVHIFMSISTIFLTPTLLMDYNSIWSLSPMGMSLSASNPCAQTARRDWADNIPAKFIKLVAEYLAGPLTLIINNCIKNSYFPKSWKIARVSPIHSLRKIFQRRVNNYAQSQSFPSYPRYLRNWWPRRCLNSLRRPLCYTNICRATVKGIPQQPPFIGIRDDICRAMKRER